MQFTALASSTGSNNCWHAAGLLEVVARRSTADFLQRHLAGTHSQRGQRHARSAERSVLLDASWANFQSDQHHRPFQWGETLFVRALFHLAFKGAVDKKMRWRRRRWTWSKETLAKNWTRITGWKWVACWPRLRPTSVKWSRYLKFFSEPVSVAFCEASAAKRDRIAGERWTRRWASWPTDSPRETSRRRRP